MPLETINKVDPECYLKYVEYVLGQRHAELVSFKGVHLGPVRCQFQYAAAHYKLNQAAMTAVSNLAKENGLDLWSYSRGQAGKPDTRHFLSCFEEQGIEFKDLPWNDNTDFNHTIMSIPENHAKIKAYQTLSQAAQLLGWKGNDPEDMANFLCKELGFNKD